MRPVRRPQHSPLGKPLRRFFRAGWLVFACASSLRAQIPFDRIPSLKGVTLTGQPTALPAALQGRVGILVIGFSRESRAPAAAWGKRLSTDFDQSPHVLYFELPVLEEVPRLLRGVVLRAIGREVSPAAQAHFLPVTSNEAQWKSIVHFTDANAAYVLVVDGAGAIHWQTSGDPTDDRYASLRQAVSSAQIHPSPAP